MQINIKTIESEQEINILRVFKNEDNRIFLLGDAVSNFVFIELVAFNYVTVLAEVDGSIAEHWLAAAVDEELSFNDTSFRALTTQNSNKILNQAAYEIIVKKNGEYWQVQQPEIEDDILPVPFHNTIVRILMTRTNPTAHATIDDYLDRIREVGIDNLTAAEKQSLDTLTFEQQLA